jgi:Lipid A 3-O-deacylase (PagL)
LFTFAAVAKIVLLILLSALPVLAQTNDASPYFIDANYYYGSLLVQNKNVAQLNRNQPEGLILSFNIKTDGEKLWHHEYGYPDWGLSLGYQNFKSDVLGQNISAYGHFNFYFFSRKLQLRVAQGVGINTAPFDLETNFKNNAYGSRVLASSYLMVNYQQKNIYKGFGLQAGLSFVHHSNGSFRAPNSGTNLFAINLGIRYDFDAKEPVYKPLEEKVDFNEPIRYNIFVRGGINEGDIVGLGQHPFLVLGGFADKRISYKSTFQLGAEIFFSKFLEKELEYRSIAFFDEELADTDYKRAAVFCGYELRISRFAVPIQLGYYFYWPSKYESPVYERIGVKYYFTESLYGTATVKAHGANAEAIEFGVGIRL